MDKTSTGLTENVAGLLCYVLGWISGLVFLIIEQENKFVRFHAIQSIVIFGSLTIVSIVLSIMGLIPYLGVVFDIANWILGLLAFVSWIVLMVKAGQGELYKVPVVGHVVEGIQSVTWRGKRSETEEEERKTDESSGSNDVPKPLEPLGVPSPTISEKMEEVGKQVENYFSRSRSGRIAGYGASIFGNVVLLIFFSFFHQYIALYNVEPDGSITRLSMLTGDYFIWLPILITALIISITANIIMIIYDKYWFREIIQIILTMIGVVVTANLISIFPFDFSVIPNATAVYFMPVVVTILLIIIAVGLGVGALVRFIKLIVRLVKPSPS